MPTKIINILPDDTFEEIFRIFKLASAEEVIFVFPKKQRALVNENHFTQLSEAAYEQDKTVLILASNPEINILAKQYNFGILTSNKKAPVFTDSEPYQLETKIEHSEEEEGDINDETADDDEIIKLEDAEELPISENSLESGDPEPVDSTGSPPWGLVERVESVEGYTSQNENDFPTIELAVAKKSEKIVSDIIKPGARNEKVNINISKRSERPFNIEMKRDLASNLDEIQSIWRLRQENTRGFARKPKRLIKKFLFKPHFYPFSLSRKTITFIVAGLVISFVSILYISMGSAKITIKPRTHALDLSLKVTSSDQILAVDPELKKIPGQLFSLQKKVEETFQATGEREVVQKAKGKITVYNGYGTTPQVLIATTRFESTGGMIFRTLKTITVPGTKVQNGKIIPGNIQVEVIADKAGDLYNISSDRFTIPAFKERGDTDRYQKFYGISETAMTGGIIGKAKVVTDQDYIQAKEIVSKKLLSAMEGELKAKTVGLLVLGSSKPLTSNTTSTAQPDEAVDTFTVSETAELQTIGFKELSLLELITKHIENINDLTVLPERLKLDFKDLKFNNEKGSLNFTVYIKGPAYSRIDEEKIIADLMGKNEQNIKNYIGSLEYISSARVILSPFWVKRVPANREKIKLDIQYE